MRPSFLELHREKRDAGKVWSTFAVKHYRPTGVHSSVHCLKSSPCASPAEQPRQSQRPSTKTPECSKRSTSCPGTQYLRFHLKALNATEALSESVSDARRRDRKSVG